MTTAGRLNDLGAAGNMMAVTSRPVTLYALALFAALLGGCARYAGVDLSEPLDDDKQECVECALRAHTDRGSVEAAAEKFSTACEAGDARSCSALGVMREEGRGVDKDTKRAERLYSHACRKGNARACVNLGDMYERAVNGPQDLDGAIVMYDLACSGWMAEGCFRLGRARYKNGEVAAAIETLRIACKRDHPEACEALGTMYRHGHGRKRDRNKARRYYMRACKLGRNESCERLDHILRPAVAETDDPYD